MWDILRGNNLHVFADMEKRQLKAVHTRAATTSAAMLDAMSKRLLSVTPRLVMFQALLPRSDSISRLAITEQVHVHNCFNKVCRKAHVPMLAYSDSCNVMCLCRVATITPSPTAGHPLGP